jgi:hypothetical protein
MLLVSQELILDQHGASKVLDFTVAAILEYLKTTIGDNRYPSDCLFIFRSINN